MKVDYVKLLDDLNKQKELGTVSEAEYEVKKAKILVSVAEEEKKSKAIEEQRIKSVNNRKGCGTSILIILGFGLFIAMCETLSNKKSSSTTQSAAYTPTVSTNDDSKLMQAYVKARRALKNNLNDADSYDEVDYEKYFKKNKKGKRYIQVYIKYRAKNAFGGVVLNENYFDFDEDLNIIKVK